MAGNSVGQAKGLIQPREEKRRKKTQYICHPTVLGMAWVSRAWSLDLGMMNASLSQSQTLPRPCLQAAG